MCGAPICGSLVVDLRCIRKRFHEELIAMRPARTPAGSGMILTVCFGRAWTLSQRQVEVGHPNLSMRSRCTILGVLADLQTVWNRCANLFKRTSACSNAYARASYIDQRSSNRSGLLFGSDVDRLGSLTCWLVRRRLAE